MIEDGIIRLHDADWVRAQYSSDRCLAARTSVWGRSGGATPQDVVLSILEGCTDVLEVGCGKGELAGRIQASGHRVFATDHSPSMASATATLGVTALAADVRCLPFPEGSFDAAVAAWVLYHLADVPAALEEIRRVLRRRGLLIAVTVGNEHLADLWKAAGLSLAPPTFSRENGEELLRGCFADVRRIDLEAWAEFPDRRTAVRYLESTGVWKGEIDEAAFPMKVSGSPTVFLASTET